MRVDQALLPIQTIGEQIYLRISIWIGYSIQMIRTCSPYLQGPLKATFVVCALNIVFFQLALGICRLTHRMIDYFSSYNTLSDVSQLVRRFVLGSLFILTVGSANHAFRIMLKLPLPLWQFAGIGILTDLTCLFWKTKDA